MQVITRICFVFLFAAAAFGQTTFGSITGSVSDATGAVVTGARITATHLGSNYAYTAESNAAGNFNLANLREGEYSIRVHAQGFKEAVIPKLPLASLDVRRVDIQLEVGAVETSVEVSAGATLIETETARISDNKNAMQLKALPMNTRSLWNFIGLSPGVVQAGNGSATRRFAGSRANQSDASIDGITLSNQYDGTQISPLVSNIESFEEVRVDMANNTAEFGSIGQVTIVSKGGSNELHGSAFDYYSTPWFRARNPFAAARPSGVRHEPGFSVGGPVLIPKVYDGRNRTFFFYSFETSRGSQILSLLNPTVPPAPWRAGDLTSLGDVRDPFNGNAPFPNRMIPASRISPVAQKIQDRFYPLPSGDPNFYGAQNYVTQMQRPFDPNTYWTTRGDHRFSERHFVFGRYTWNRSHSRDFESNLPTVGRRWQTRNTRAMNLSYTATIRSNLVNEFRWGYAWNNNPLHGPLMGMEIVRELGLTGLAPGVPDTWGVPNISFSNLSIQNLTQSPARDPGFLNHAQQFQEHISWFRGKHNLKAGVLLGRTKFQDLNQNTALFGALTFSNRFTGQTYGDFLLGIPTTAQRAAPTLLVDRLRWSSDFFVTDEYKVSSRLTLNLGLRYEIHPAWDERMGRVANFDPSTGKIVVADGSLDQISPLFPSGYVDVVEASSLGFHPKTLIRNDWNNIAPRIGIAWRPFGANTVVRAGYGIFYDVVPRTASAASAPFVVNEPAFTNPTPVPTLLLPNIFPDSVAGPTSVSLPNAVRPDLRIPYSMQYNFTLEHQRWSTGFRASYIGTNTRQGEWGYNINQPVADSQPFISKPRMFPNYPAITYITNGAGHQYNSLTLEAERRFARGVGYQLSWVWARDIGDLERGEQPEDAYNRQRERSVWLDIPRHRITGNLIYELPFGRGKRFLSNGSRVARAIAGDWEFNSVYSFYSGQFLTPLWTGPDPTGTRFTTSGTAAQVTIRPDQLRDANLPTGDRSTQRWFDGTAFGAPQPGSFGTSAKGVIMGPGSAIVNAGLSKYFYLKERLRVRLEITATNLFNTPNYANPVVNVSSQGTVGVISGTAGVSSLDSSGARAFRTGIRAEW